MRDWVAKLVNHAEQVQPCAASIAPRFGPASTGVDDTKNPFTTPALASETRTKETV
jgi:hypothetical protein